MQVKEWRCAAVHCPGKSKIPLILRRVYQCKFCGRRYHAGCGGGSGYEGCDDCWYAKEVPRRVK
jgi:hypothetical protein